MFQLYFVSVTLKGYEWFSFNRSYVFHLAGHLRTAILTDTINVACLRITLGTQCKQGQNDTLCKDQEPEKRSTLSRGTYSYSPYKGAPRSVVSKLLLILDDIW